MTIEPASLPSSSIKIQTPEGTLFVHIIESPPGIPAKLDLNIGKAGSAVLAWAHAFAKVASICLRNGIPISAIADEISGINTDRITTSLDRIVRSGPDGIAQAILIYLESKKPKITKHRGRRGPSVFGEEV